MQLLQGMREVIKCDPLAHDALVELLLPRLCHYYDGDQTASPLALDKCTSQVSPPATDLHMHSMLVQRFHLAIVLD